MNKQPRNLKGRITVMAASFTVAAIGIVTPYAITKHMAKGAPLHPRTILMCGAASLVLLSLGYGLIPEMEQDGTISLIDIYNHFNRSQSHEQGSSAVMGNHQNQRAGRGVQEGDGSPEPEPD